MASPQVDGRRRRSERSRQAIVQALLDLVGERVPEPTAQQVAEHGGRVFLTVGRQELAAFAGLPRIWFLVRLIETPEDGLPLDSCRLLLGRGPFDEEAEAELLREHRAGQRGRPVAPDLDGAPQALRERLESLGYLE